MYFISLLLTSFPFIFVGEKLSECIEIFSVRKLDTGAVPPGNAGNIPNVCVASVETDYAQLPVRADQVFERNIWRE